MYNQRLLMCRPDYFTIQYSINPHMNEANQPDPVLKRVEHEQLVEAHLGAGRKVEFITPHPDWPDMLYTANAALIRGKKAVMGNLPKERQGEVDLMRKWLVSAGYETIDCPFQFSGQGDSLPTGTGAVIKGRGWRSDPRSDDFVHDALGYEVIPIQTISDDWYDDDLVIGVVKPGLLAVCFDALDRESQKRLQARNDLTCIRVSLNEAKRGACNFVSDGRTVTLRTGTPELTEILTRMGFNTQSVVLDQIWLGGGLARCTALALDAF